MVTSDNVGLALSVIGMVAGVVVSATGRWHWGGLLTVVCGLWLLGWKAFGVGPLASICLVVATAFMAGVLSYFAGVRPRPDSRTVCLDAMGVDTVHCDGKSQNPNIAGRIVRAREITIVSPGGWGPISRWQREFVTALTKDGSARVTVFVEDPFSEQQKARQTLYLGGILPNATEAARKLWAETHATALQKVSGEDRHSLHLQIRLHRSLAGSHSLIVCDDWAWYTQYLPPSHPQDSMSMEVSRGGALWPQIEHHISKLRRPEASYPLALDAPIPVATFAMEKWVTVTMNNVHEAFLPGELILREEGTIAALVDLPAKSQRPQKTTNQFLWAATKRCCAEIRDGLVLYYAPRPWHHGQPEWVATATTGMFNSETRQDNRVSAHASRTDECPEARPCHFAVTWNHAKTPSMDLWIDGEHVAKADLKPKGELIWPDSTGSRLCIGHFPSMGEWFFLPWPIAGFAVFDRVLTEEEIAAWKTHSLSVVQGS